MFINLYFYLKKTLMTRYEIFDMRLETIEQNSKSAKSWKAPISLSPYNVPFIHLTLIVSTFMAIISKI